MEQRNAELRENPRQGADTADRFLHDLRELRTQAELDHGELAARAHYPRDAITAAETGPTLPELPVLAAYVRGCGGEDDDVAGWEDRWRSVTGAAASPLLPTRAAGSSDGDPGQDRPTVPRTDASSTDASRTGGSRPSSAAATAATAATVDGQDSTAILAALNRFAERMAQPTPDGQPPQAAPPAQAARPARPAPDVSGAEAVRSPTAGPAAADGPPGADAGPPEEDATSHGGDISGRVLIIAVIAVALLCLLALLLAL